MLRLDAQPALKHRIKNRYPLLACLDPPRWWHGAEDRFPGACRAVSIDYTQIGLVKFQVAAVLDATILEERHQAREAEELRLKRLVRLGKTASGATRRKRHIIKGPGLEGKTKKAKVAAVEEEPGDAAGEDSSDDVSEGDELLEHGSGGSAEEVEDRPAQRSFRNFHHSLSSVFPSIITPRPQCHAPSVVSHSQYTFYKAFTAISANTSFFMIL